MIHKCRCWEMGLRPNMTYEQLLEEIVRPEKYCTAGQFICSTLDAELKRADQERQRRKYYSKRLKAQGYSEEQISNMPQKSRRQPVIKSELSLNDL